MCMPLPCLPVLPPSLSACHPTPRCSPRYDRPSHLCVSRGAEVCGSMTGGAWCVVWRGQVFKAKDLNRVLNASLTVGPRVGGKQAAEPPPVSKSHVDCVTVPSARGGVDPRGAVAALLRLQGRELCRTPGRARHRHGAIDGVVAEEGGFFLGGDSCDADERRSSGPPVGA